MAGRGVNLWISEEQYKLLLTEARDWRASPNGAGATWRDVAQSEFENALLALAEQRDQLEKHRRQ